MKKFSIDKKFSHMKNVRSTKISRTIKKILDRQRNFHQETTGYRQTSRPLNAMFRPWKIFLNWQNYSSAMAFHTHSSYSL